jgi:ParB/RepB/Spo0J family partition protein
MTVVTDPGRMALDSLEHLAIADLHDNPHNPRHDVGDLTEMKASIVEHGILQPLLVTPNADETYTVVAGHRRIAALRELAWATPVPCVIREMTDTERAAAAVIENLHREGLDPLDEATGFQHLADLGHSQREIAELVGCNQSHVSRRLKLIDLDPRLVELVRSDKLPLRQAEELGDVDDELAAVLSKKAEKGGTLGTYDIEQARTTVRKRRIRAEAKSTGLPELKNSWEGTKVDTAGEATHWYEAYDSTRGGYVLGFRNVPPKATPEQVKSAGGNRRTEEEKRAADRQRAEERGVERRQLAAAHIDDLVDWAITEAIDEGVYSADCRPEIVLELIGIEPGDIDEGDALQDAIVAAKRTRKSALRMLTAMAVDIVDQTISRSYAVPHSAGPYLDALKGWGWPLDNYEGQVRQEWMKAREPTDAAGIAEAPAIAACRECGCTDEIACEGGCSWVEDGLCSACVDAVGELDDVDESEPPAAEVVREPEAPQVDGPDQADEFWDPADPPKRPWPTYDGNDERLIRKMVSSFTVPAAVHDVIAYETATLGRQEVLDVCEATLAKLAR